MPLNPTIRYYVNGEEVDEDILNRPLEDIVANLGAIFEVTDKFPDYDETDARKYVRINNDGTAFMYTHLEFDSIRPPTAISPLDGDSGVIATPDLQATEYAPVYSNDQRVHRQFQLDLEGENFVNPIREVYVNADNWIVSPDLSDYPGGTFVWRCRDESDIGDVSQWSEPQTFSVSDAYVRTPSVSVQQDGTKALRAPIISASAFNVFGSPDTHLNTDWEIVRVSDGVVVWSSYSNSVDLESIQVPEQQLTISTEYKFRVKYNSSTYGSSAWGSTIKTTVSYYIKTPVITTNDTGVEFSDHLAFIENYDPSLNYIVTVSGGSFTRENETITWTLPEVTQDTTHQITVYATNEYAEESDTVTKNVNVLDVPLVSDDAYIITNFSLYDYNNIWST